MTPEQLRMIPLEDLVIASDRRVDQSLDPSLVASIRTHGLLQPVVVEPDGCGRYTILAGRRRCRHARAAGLREIPVLVRGAGDNLERLMIEAEENAHRRDWSPLEVADLCRELTEDHGWTQAHVAEWLSDLLGRSVPRAQISQYMALNALTDAAKVQISNGTFSFSWARELARLNATPGLQRTAVAEILEELARKGGDDEAPSTRSIRRKVDRLLTPAELISAERGVEGEKATEKSYEGEGLKSKVKSQTSEVADGFPQVHDSQFTIHTEGDPLVGLYLEQVAEGLGYLASSEMPAEVREMVEEVVRLGESFRLHVETLEC